LCCVVVLLCRSNTLSIESLFCPMGRLSFPTHFVQSQFSLSNAVLSVSILYRNTKYRVNQITNSLFLLKYNLSGFFVKGENTYKIFILLKFCHIFPNNF
jgi:hypothetical protein